MSSSQNTVATLRARAGKGRVGVQRETRGRDVLTYADDIHEAIHAVTDLEEQILPLPLG